MINEKQAKKYCKEDISKIKNYDLAIADTTQTWECHHMTETWWNCSEKDLIENECYYGRKACELIFLTKAEHTSLHKKGKTFTEEHRIKLSEALKGRTLSDECRRKLSEAKKGRKFTEEHCIKLSEARKGKPSGMKGKTLSEEARKKMSDSHKGHIHSEETRIKMSEAHKRRCAMKKNLSMRGTK